MILRSLEIARAEIILLAPEKPTWEEIYEELDFSPTLTPLSLEEPILLNINEEKEAAINWIETFEDEERVWINAKLIQLMNSCIKEEFQNNHPKKSQKNFLNSKRFSKRNPLNECPKKRNGIIQ